MHTAKATGLFNLEERTASEVLPIIRGTILKLIAEDPFISKGSRSDSE